MSIYSFVFLNACVKVSLKGLPSLALSHQNFSCGAERTFTCDGFRTSAGKSSTPRACEDDDLVHGLRILGSL